MRLCSYGSCPCCATKNKADLAAAADDDDDDHYFANLHLI